MTRRECLNLLAAAPLLRAQSAAWKAGVAKTVITPKESIWLAGYGNRTKASEGVAQDLYVKALALQSGSERPAVIVTSDLLGFPRDVSDPIARECQSRFGLSRERLILNSSHTHSGPVIGSMLKPAYPKFTEQQEDTIARYTHDLIGRVVATVGKAISDLAPATVSFTQTAAGFGVNRRRAANRSLPGPVDPDVPVLAIRDPGGKARAILFGYACHNTSLGSYKVHGDWAGFAQAEIEQRYPGAVALYMQGCGADINPIPRYQGEDPALEPYAMELPRMYGKIISAAVDIALHQRVRAIDGPIRAVLEPVELSFHPIPTREEFRARLHGKNESMARHAEMMLNKLEHDGKLPDRYSYPVQLWRLNGLKLIALAGEVVVDYSLRLKAQYGPEGTWVAGYCNDVFAYIPSLRVLKEGGYEGGGAMIPYGQPAPFGAAVEEQIIERVHDLFQSLGG